MYRVTKNGDTTQSDILEITADLKSDVAELPTTCGAGSSCLVLEDSSVWVLGSDRKWHQI